MIIGFLIIIIFPFIFFYTQVNNLGKKTNAIKEAIEEGKETYIDTVDMCERWTATGEKVYHTTWHYCKTRPEQDAIDGDKVLMGLNTFTVYKNYSKESYIADIQWKIDHEICWCWERHAFNEKKKEDCLLHYHMKDKYFYRLGWDNTTHNYCITYHSTDNKEIISYEKYKELGGYDLKDRTRGYRR